MQAAALWMNRSGRTRSGRKSKAGARTSAGLKEVKALLRGSQWTYRDNLPGNTENEDKETMTGLIFSLDGKDYRARTRKQITDEQSLDAK